VGGHLRAACASQTETTLSRGLRRPNAVVRATGRAIALLALTLCVHASSAHARVETIRWIHNDPGAIDGFRIYARYEGEGYQQPLYDGNPVPQNGVYSVSFDVDDNETVYFVATAYNQFTESVFSNEIIRLAPTCGDGNVDAGEVCDDGNTANGDGCRADCTLELCGDGVNDPGEMCDDGNTANGDGCRSNCTAELCGDGIRDASEQCDDGNTANGDGCDAACRVEPDPVCGDGNLDAGEQCDDGNTANGDGCDAVCQLEPDPVCGDGNLDAGEQCDDGNTANGDGCDAVCQLEPDPVCGDGNLDAGEQCDDGNTASGDGCDAACQLEPDPTCGDGNLDAGEQCDDGNTANGDRCDENCQIEEIEPPELLLNSDFDDGMQLASWSPIDPSVPAEWDPTDVDGWSDSGSARVANPYRNASGVTGLESECIPVIEGGNYEWSGWGNRMNSERGRLFVGVAWYPDRRCQGGEFQQAVASDSLVSGQWIEVGGQGTAPSGSEGAVVRVMTLKDAAFSSKPLVAQVDGVVFAPEAGAPGLVTVVFLTLGASRRWIESPVWGAKRPADSL